MTLPRAICSQLSSCAVFLSTLAAPLLVAPNAYAEKVIWHYDSLPSVMDDLATGLKQHPMYAHPGFVKGEAWGVLFKPKPEDYPVKILTVELVMAQAEGQKDQKGNFSIEIYNDDGAGPAPKAAPVFSITTNDFAAGGNIGQPVVGNNGMIYSFDWTKPENHPPLIDKGNIYLVIRYLEESASLESMWGKSECTKMVTGLGLDLCGCQKLAALTEQKATIKGVNLMNIVWPLGTCSGTKVWKFVEQISTTNVDMKGNFILRMGVDGVAPVDPDAGGSSGGDTSSGGSDASVVKDTAVVAPATPEISAVTPNSGPADKPNSIDVYGKNFQKGLTAKLGIEAIKVNNETVTSNGFSAVVVGLGPGIYDLVVKNPDGSFAIKAEAYTVKAAVAADVHVAESAPETVGETSVETANRGPETGSGGPFSVEAVSPTCVATSKDVLVTVLGLGFVKGMKLSVGSVTLQAVDVQTPGKVSGLLPKGLAVGEYTLFAELATGEQKALANAVRVAISCEPSTVGNSTASGCSAGAQPRGPAGWLTVLVAAVALMFLGLRRQRLAFSRR
ncbi:MAG: hypothetical protein EXR77_08485 [Myxococcales bacterium]|nr:hypothetical protein [Myxococcales bacterium]